MPKPNTTDYPEYFGKYINEVVEEDLSKAFNNQDTKIDRFLQSVPQEKADYAYAPGKWTLKELLQHIIDAERIFNYRALCFARKETISLPSFDENLYADNSNANLRSWESLSGELINVRKSTKDLFTNFTNEVLQRRGISNNNSSTVLSLGFIIVGHVNHHIKIAEDRYLL